MDYGFRYRHGVHATTTSFVDPAAVEAWDAWFRWRDGNELKDITVDATWSRVTQALCAIAPGATARDESRIGDAVGSWRLLVDPRVLARAGTPGFAWPRNEVTVALNVARFVSLPFTTRAAFQRDAFDDTVDLALRTLDDMRAAAGAGTPLLSIVGLADALAMLGADYTTPQGRACAATIARQFAQASLTASVQLAQERGVAGASRFDAAALVRAECLKLPVSTLDAIRRHGLRLGTVTGIVPQPRLALVANNVADAIEPLAGEKRVYTIAGMDGERRVVASGFALTLWRQLGATSADAAVPFRCAADVGTRERALMRAALRPWFDHPIDEPANTDIPATRPTPSLAAYR
jgi:ribonucleoside-diphosphate reductase alpha chain